MGSITTNGVKRIAIIGAGPSGISTAKYLLAEKAFSKVQIFEQSGSVEGAWRHTGVDASDKIEIPQQNSPRSVSIPKEVRIKDGGSVFTTPMYDHLETNIPHQLMAFSDKPFPEDAPLYPSRETVSKYLEEYALEVEELIKFNAQAHELEFRSINGDDLWYVTYLDLLTRKVHREPFDAVAVCSGHYEIPYIPNIPGIKEWNRTYEKSILHSKLYRSAEGFRGQKVVVVGNAASGIDIASQISTVSKHPVMISQRSRSWLAGSNSKSQESRLLSVPQIAEFLMPSEAYRAVRFTDGRIETDIDQILFCTGYQYSFPFLPSLEHDLLKDASRVHNVYQYLFYMDQPSLAFIGLPIRVIPFPLAEVQAAVLAKVWSGKLSLPSKLAMKEWEKNAAIENGEGKKFLTLDNSRDFKYHNALYDWASEAGFETGKKPTRWSEQDFWLRARFANIRKEYVQKGEARFLIKKPEELGFDFDAALKSGSLEAPRL